METRRLQKLERKDGSSIFLIYLPTDDVESAGLSKGDSLGVTAEHGKLTLTKTEGNLDG